MQQLQELAAANWPILVVAIVLIVLLAWWLILGRRKTRVERSEVPGQESGARRNQALIDAPPAAGSLSSAANEHAIAAAPAAADAETGPAIVPTTRAPQEAAPEVQAASPAPPAAAATDDDLSRIKGVGPKLVALLGELGVTSYAQIAGWDEAEIDRVDAQLGRFRGRIRRDNWVQQARLLESGDMAAYEGQFGRS